MCMHAYIAGNMRRRKNCKFDGELATERQIDWIQRMVQGVHTPLIHMRGWQCDKVRTSLIRTQQFLVGLAGVRQSQRASPEHHFQAHLCSEMKLHTHPWMVQPKQSIAGASLSSSSLQ